MENQINLVHKGLREEKEEAFDQIVEESDDELEEQTSTESLDHENYGNNNNGVQTRDVDALKR